MTSPGEWGVCFDLDNTLYRLDSTNGTFAGSKLKFAVMDKACRFLAWRLGITPDAAILLLAEAKQMGSLSLVFEQYYGIDRYEWFANTWNLDPAEYILPAGPDLRRHMAPFAGRAVVLTSGPRVWAQPALDFLGVGDFFRDRLITGEPDMRKPNPEVFIHAARLIGRHPSRVVSVGDQNHSDILPAQSVGMRTIMVGPEAGSADFRADDILHAIAILHTLEK